MNDPDSREEEGVGENDPVPVPEEFPSDLNILIGLLSYCAQEGYPEQISIDRGFGLQFGGAVDPAKVINRAMELEQEYLKMAANSESSLVLHKDKMKYSISKMIWHRKYGHTEQIVDIKFLRNVLECSTKKQGYPSGKDDAKRMKKLQKKYLRSLKIEDGMAKYSMSPEDEEFLGLARIVWSSNAPNSTQVSGQEWKSFGRPEEPLSPTKRTLNDLKDIDILYCAIAYCVKNKEYPSSFSDMIEMCRDFLRVDVEEISLVWERFERLRWKYQISVYDQEIFRLSRILWGDTLGDSWNQDSAEESSCGGDEDDNDKNKNDQKDESPKS